MDVALVPSSDDLEGHSEMFFDLAELVKAGLPGGAALRAVTVVPAKFLGLEERFGALAPGRDGSFVVLDGDPLSGRARVLRVFLRGEEVYREDPESHETGGEAVE